MFLNIAALHKRLTHPPRILVIFVRPMAATALMAAGAYLSYEAVIAHTGSLLISVGLSIAAACLIYAVMILSMGVITWDDCMLLPNGQKIARLLHITPD
jgi:stage V sporulation protein B